MKEKEVKEKELLGFGIIGGLIASLCCLGPVLLVMFGLSGVSFALSIGQYTWFFLSVGVLFLVATLIFHLNKENCCNVEGLKSHWKQMLIAFVLLVAVLIIIKYWLATYLAELVYR